MEKTIENLLNVTLIEPRFKHPTIFARFDELFQGESLTLLNDHDPKPLYYQLLNERGDIFTWEYLEQGPADYLVKITKKVFGKGEETLGEIATKDLRKAQIFKKYGLDFCCGGKKTVKEACNEKGLDFNKIEQELQQTEFVHSNSSLPYNDWAIDFLADYIVNTHHVYLEKNLPDLRYYANKVKNVHGNKHPELIEVHSLVEAINDELITHMQKEETVLFPYIKELVSIKKNNKKLEQIPFGSVENPINMMEHEHQELGEYLEKISLYTDKYKIPSDACASYSFLYRMLAEMEDDIHLHIHLENNILFPKAIELEKKLKQ